MPQLSRRALLQSSAVIAAPLVPAPGGPGIRRDLLTKAWPVDRVAKVLSPRERFQPFPAAGERGAWEALPGDARAALVHSAENELKTSWEGLPATLALEFKRDGNRSRYEAVRDRRRKKLQDLVIAECMEGQGRFIDEISNGIWLTCEESFWGIPAHLGAQKAGTGLPDITEPIVDLFAAETASLLSWTAYLLAPQLTGVSKMIPERIRVETDRRLLTPCLARDDFGWMGFNGKAVNNWNPWISSNWLTAALLQETDERRRRAAVQKILRCLDNFMNGYSDDGGCDEGPGYWGRAGASLFDCLELLHSASGGALNGFSQPLVREIGLYICRAHVYNEWYTNFADAPARVDINGDLIYRFGNRVQDETMMRHGAFGAFLRDEDAIPQDSIGRQLPALFNLAALRKTPRAQSLLRDTWLPGVQVMAARVKADSAQGLYLAAQGGHNAESHNHNDVGNFLVYANGAPAIIDVGVETYTAKTFSAKRYEIWTMQSAYHNCPTIDGVMQGAGREFAASAVAYRSDDAASEFRLNLAHAYPKEANLEVWNRTLQLDRAKNEIEIVDDWRLKRAAGVITLTLMTPCKVTQKGPGVLSLAVAAGNAIDVLYDGRVFKPAIEEIRLEDGRLRRSWGERLYRILLNADNAGAEGKWSMRIMRS